jgi:PIN domain nuclease of toxin-antitoxin system
LNRRSGLLFDTQALILWATDTIPRPVVARVGDGDQVYVSILSFWEFLLKGQYRDTGVTPDQLRELSSALDAQIIDIQFAHLEILRSLPFIGSGKTLHKDPFDRLIVAQAISEGLVLVGGDRRFPQYQKTAIGKGLQILWS